MERAMAWSRFDIHRNVSLVFRRLFARWLLSWNSRTLFVVLIAALLAADWIFWPLLKITTVILVGIGLLRMCSRRPDGRLQPVLNWSEPPAAVSVLRSNPFRLTAPLLFSPYSPLHSLH